MAPQKPATQAAAQAAAQKMEEPKQKQSRGGFYGAAGPNAPTDDLLNQNQSKRNSFLGY